MGKNIKAILFDSGKVLNGPVTGHWFISPDFFAHIKEKEFSGIPKARRNAAFHKAGQYLAKQNLILTQEDEYKHFLQYYRIFFDQLPELKTNQEQIVAVASDLVFNDSKYKFYQDVMKVVPELHKNYKLAVVSDAWPSLENVFAKADMKKYFSSFVVSSMKGVAKPHEMMYREALEELAVAPAEAVFIDDNIRNCNGARKLGINSLLLCRDWRVYAYNKVTCREHKVIHDLKNLERILKK
jgi:putative hydrolase of the HAD superfamily